MLRGPAPVTTLLTAQLAKPRASVLLGLGGRASDLKLVLALPPSGGVVLTLHVASTWSKSAMPRRMIGVSGGNAGRERPAVCVCRKPSSCEVLASEGLQGLHTLYLALCFLTMMTVTRDR